MNICERFSPSRVFPATMTEASEAAHHMLLISLLPGVRTLSMSDTEQERVTGRDYPALDETKRTGIVDDRVSRKQVLLRRTTNAKELDVEAVGQAKVRCIVRTGGVDGCCSVVQLKTGERHTLSEADELQLLVTGPPATNGAAPKLKLAAHWRLQTPTIADAPAGPTNSAASHHGSSAASPRHDELGTVSVGGSGTSPEPAQAAAVPCHPPPSDAASSSDAAPSAASFASSSAAAEWTTAGAADASSGAADASLAASSSETAALSTALRAPSSETAAAAMPAAASCAAAASREVLRARLKASDDL
jgi:hypothetical protein